MSSIYNKIYDFCKVRNLGSCLNNGQEKTNRVKFIERLLTSEGISYYIDEFSIDNTDNKYFNIIIEGTSSNMAIAHHDICNPNIDNANDNSASIINLIALKKLLPNLRVVFTDGEEFGGIGSNRLSEQINNGDFGNIEYVLNVELSGIGGRNFFIGDYPGKLSDKIVSMFNCPIFRTPYNDSVTIRKNGIDSVVINPLPIDLDGVSNLVHNGVPLNTKILFNCHTPKDTVDKISIEDMKVFTEEVLYEILK